MDGTPFVSNWGARNQLRSSDQANEIHVFAATGIEFEALQRLPDVCWALNLPPSRMVGVTFRVDPLDPRLECVRAFASELATGAAQMFRTQEAEKKLDLRTMQVIKDSSTLPYRRVNRVGLT